MSKKVIIWSSVGAVVAAGIGYLIYKNRPNQKIEDEVKDDVKKETTKSCVVFPLKKGSGSLFNSCGKEQVKKVQQALNVLAYSPMLPLKVDGVFGAKTESHLSKLYQTVVVSETLYNKMTKPTATTGWSATGANW